MKPKGAQRRQDMMMAKRRQASRRLQEIETIVEMSFENHKTQNSQTNAERHDDNCHEAKRLQMDN
jgi:hypothetical protein